MTRKAMKANSSHANRARIERTPTPGPEKGTRGVVLNVFDLSYGAASTVSLENHSGKSWLGRYNRLERHLVPELL